MKNRGVTVRVPASTSNLGSGFDTCGVALALYNRVTVGPKQQRAHTNSINDEPMVREATDAFFAHSQLAPFEPDVTVKGAVPIARGLGSSVTLRVGIVAGLNALTKAGLTQQDLLDVVSELEHHPDNAAPAIFGGFAVAGLVGKNVRCLHVPVSARLRFVALIPNFEVSTEHARRLVPQQFSKADTVHSLNRAALITGAFVAGRYKLLSGLFDDRVHQPYRQKLIPQLTDVVRAGEDAGALGGWLSGSGSTIICLSEQRTAQKIGRAMQRFLPDSTVKILKADNRGLVIQR